LEGELQTFFVGCKISVTPTMASRSTILGMAVKWRLSPRKGTEFAHGGFLWNFFGKPRSTAVTGFMERNSSTQNTFSG
jgi:hypothetical protein